jgi:hypothetical protein
VKNALNANLPPDIYVRFVKTTEDRFNPRFDATRRIYHYFILNQQEPDIFNRSNYWWFPYDLNINRMREAARYFEGVHDFTTFQKRTKGKEKDPVRLIYRVKVYGFKGNRLILVRVEGLSFLRRMVRNIVGETGNQRKSWRLSKNEEERPVPPQHLRRGCICTKWILNRLIRCITSTRLSGLKPNCWREKNGSKRLDNDLDFCSHRRLHDFQFPEKKEF